MKLPKQGEPLRVELPFELKSNVGLGDAIKRLTTALGIRTCEPCERRAAFLNRQVVLTGRKRIS